MTQCISRRRGSDLRPSIMRPVCFLQIARVRDACLLSLPLFQPKPCQAPPPPWAALLLTGWWVYIPTRASSKYLRIVYDTRWKFGHNFPRQREAAGD